MKFWVSFTEKFGQPLVWAQVPRGSAEAEYQKVADLMNETVQDGVLVTPEDSKVELLSGTGNGSSDNFKQLCDFMNNEMSKAILGQTLTTESTGTGTQALGTVHQGVREDLIQQDKRMIEDCFNTLIRWIIEVNVGDSKDMPLFSLYKIEDVDMNQAKRDHTLADTGQIQFTQEYIDKTYGFEKGQVLVVKPPEQQPEEKEGKEDNASFSELEFKESPFKDQQAIDALITSLSPADLQNQTDFIKPIIALGKRSSTFGDLKAGLLDIFEEVRPNEMEEKLRNFLFVSETWGNINGAEN